jgi:hypothetical protein
LDRKLPPRFTLDAAIKGAHHHSVDDGVMAAARVVTARWFGKTLENLRQEAAKELNGTAYEAFRESDGGKDGPRIFLAVCVTGPHELALVEKTFDFADTGTAMDWETNTLADLLVETVTGEEMGYQDLVINGKRLAVVLMAAGRNKVDVLEKIFCLPR